MTEYERQIHFQKMPSRFQSYFACESMKDINIWIDHLKIENPRIAEVYFSTRNVHKLDAQFLNPPAEYSNLVEVFYTHNYWNKSFSSQPLPELLIGGEITVTKFI